MSDITVEELLTYIVARYLKDEEVGFVGIGTGGPAFILAVGIPIAAARLAMYTHAPNFVLMQGPVIDPDLDFLPKSTMDRHLIEWKCKSQIPCDYALDIFKRGKMDVGFVSGAQVDKYGNLNIISIGDYNKPKIRLVGCLAQSDHCAHAGRTFIMMKHEKRRFVEKVDAISGAGFLDGKGAREKTGLKGGGPGKVFTDLAVLSFDEESKRMKLDSVHPGVTIEEVKENTGFELLIPDDVIETPKPSSKELSIIRNSVDPNGELLKGKMGGHPATSING